MTTRRTRGTDRLATVLLGLVLIAVGLLSWEWRLDLTGLLTPSARPGRGRLRRRQRLVAVGLPRRASPSGLLGLLWLLAHLPRPTRGTTRLAAQRRDRPPRGGPRLARQALAERWASLAPVTGARGRTLPDAPDVVVLTGHVELEADAAALLDAAARSSARWREAFPDLDVRVRFLLEGPARQPRTRRTTEIAVEASAPRRDRVAVSDFRWYVVPRVVRLGA